MKKINHLANGLWRFHLLVVTVLTLPPAFSQDKKTQSTRTEVYSPAEELAGFKLAEGFVIELVASQEDGVVNPIDLTFDDAGRLWTQTAGMYPLDPVADIQWNDLLRLMDDPEARQAHPAFKRILDLYQGKTKGEDQILIIDNLYGGQKAKTTVWADGLAIPMSILPYKDGAYVMQGSELFFLHDKDQNGRSDQREPLFTGFGYTDTHTMGHVLVRAPGDCIHFSQGALNKGEVVSVKSGNKLKIDYSKIARFSLDATKMELVSSGLNNIWGYQLRGNGQWYGSEANDLGYSVAPMEPGAGFPGIGNERLRPYQPFVPKLHEFRVGGTGISGLAFADDTAGSFPSEFKNVAFLANPITSSINAVRIVRQADGSVVAEHLPDLLTAEDDWFRPVNMEFGPDGCLYIADWYNKIVSHNELPTTHPDRDKKNGRIWRIRHVSQQPREVPDFYKTKTEELPAYLKSPSLWAKRAVWHQISDRPLAETKSLVPTLIALAADASLDESSRIHALWCLESIRHYDASLITTLLTSPLPDLRREAVRSLTSFSLPPAQVAGLIQNLVEDENAMVRSQMLRILGENPQADPLTIKLLVQAAKPELPGDEMGGAYERKFERYLARRALENYPEALQAFLQSPQGEKSPAVNRLWAIEVLPKNEKEATFLTLWPEAKLDTLNETTFVGVADMLDNREIYAALQPVLQRPEQAKNYVTYALRNEARLQSLAFSTMIAKPIFHLLKSENPADVDLALDAVGRFEIAESREKVVAVLGPSTPKPTLLLALKALEISSENKAVFGRIVLDEKQSSDTRIFALNKLVQVDSAAGQQALTAWLPELTDPDKIKLAETLTASPRGAAVVMKVYGRYSADLALLPNAVMERLAKVNSNDRRSQTILAQIKKQEEDNKAEIKTKIKKYSVLAARSTGVPDEGKLLFQTCLQCHQVGNNGQNIAPALDGSASRETQALLTAILDPDAAVESGYALYRVNKKDGNVVEGYLVGKDDSGTTLAFMGGSKLYIKTQEIKNQFFLPNRSFMAKGLIDQYSDKQVADLLSYIRTLE